MAGEIVLRAARHAIEQLQKSETPYVLVGGLAAQAWGRIRSTLDVDLLLNAGTDSLSALIPAFRQAGIVPRHDEPVAIHGCSFLQFDLEDQESLMPVRVDVLSASTPFHVEAVRRGLTVELGGHPVQVATCEDLILLKLAAERPIDLADAKELFRVNREGLDLEYLRSWAAELQVEELLSQQCQV